jgi:small GTP-binding protein
MPIEAKVVLVGETSVGKTSMVNRFTSHPVGIDTRETIGGQYSSVTIDLVPEPVTLQIWDTAGQEKFRVLAPMYFHGAHVVIVVYSVDDEHSFTETRYWVDTVRAHIGESIALFLVGNKSDVSERKVEWADGCERGEAVGAEFFETSAASGAFLRELFTAVATRALVEVKHTVPVTHIEIAREIRKPAKKPCC